MAGLGGAHPFVAGLGGWIPGTLVPLEVVDSLLDAALAFPLGGPPIVQAPKIVNLSPASDENDVNLFKFVTASLRELETNVNPLSLFMALGYAKAFSNGANFFDKEIESTTRNTIYKNAAVTEPALSVGPNGITIEKTSSDPQRSIYVTRIDAGSGFQSCMFTAVVKPEVVTPGSGIGLQVGGPLNQSLIPGSLPYPYTINGGGAVNGVVLGLENGPRNTAGYVFFQKVGGNNILRIVGPNVNGVVSPDISIDFNWAGYHRYTLFWNEALGYFEVYANKTSTTPFGFFYTNRVARVPISSFNTFNGTIFNEFAANGEFSALYGIEGVIGDRVIVSEVGVTRDVGFPLLGASLPGDFYTIRESDERVFFKNEDPRQKNYSRWFDSSATIMPNPDPAGGAAVVTSANNELAFRLTKKTANKTVSIFREEPGFLRSFDNGFKIKCKLFGVSTKKVGAGTGMGILIWDGNNVFQFDMFDDTLNRTIGLLKKNGTSTLPADHFLPGQFINWGSGAVDVTILVDPGRTGALTNTVRVEMFLNDDLDTPIMSQIVSRLSLPDAADYGYADLFGNSYPPFICAGHIEEVDTAGSLDIISLEYSTIYEVWEARDNFTPDSASISPTWPLTVGSTGSASLLTGTEGQELLISCSPGQYRRYTRTTPVDPTLFDTFRGVTIEARIKINSWKALSRAGAMVIVDDGVKAFMLSFIETAEGKFVSIPKSFAGNSFKEVVGISGEGPKYSFKLDWTKYHTYKIERVPIVGTHIYVDGILKLTIPESLTVNLPQTRFSNPTISFGHYTPGEGGSSSWRYFRVRRGSGYEIGTRKNLTEPQLEDSLFATKAIVVVNLLDLDPVI